MIRASHIELLVAESEGEVIGSGYARIESAKPYLKHGRHAYLGFYVCGTCSSWKRSKQENYGWVERLGSLSKHYRIAFRCISR